jgi:DNA invertase Pin-like site-specific DNA recombinase
MSKPVEAGGGHVNDPTHPTPRELASRKKAARVKRRNAPRARRILKMKASGMSLSEIGERVGLTKQRVHAILRANEAA